MALPKQDGGICPILVACQVEIQVLLVMRRAMQGPVRRVSAYGALARRFHAFIPGPANFRTIRPTIIMKR